MATKFLARMQDVATLAKLTLDQAAAKNARKDELNIKKELLNMASRINETANKGEKSVKFNISSTAKKVDNFKAIIEAELEDQGYTYIELYNSKNEFVGYEIKWRLEDEEEESTTPDPDPETPGTETPDPANPDPENPGTETPDPEPAVEDPTPENPVVEPEYQYTPVTEEQLLENVSESPVALGWYEEDADNAGEYVLTEDTEIDEEKTYYIRSEVTE